MERYLKVRVYSARDLYTRHDFGRSHPYCKVSLSGRKFKTCASDEGGRSPVWDEVFVFPDVDPQEDQLVIKVKDKTFTSNKFLGEVRLPVSLFINGNVVDQWYTLSYDSEPAGEINLRVQLKEKMEMEPAVVVAPAMVVNAPPAYPPQQPYYQQPPPPQQYYQPQPPPQQYQQPPPPPAYGYPPPPPQPTVAYAAGPPVMVVEERHHHSPRGYDRDREYDRGYGGDYDRGYNDREERSGFSGAQMAMGVGAGLLGGVVLDKVFGDDDSD